MLPALESGVIVNDSLLNWRQYKDTDAVVSKFTIYDWHRIASDIDTEEEFATLLHTYPDRIVGLVLCHNVTGECVAFAYLLDEGGPCYAVSLHGGGWGNGLGHSLLFFRGVILLVGNLLEKGCDVITYCSKDNSRAYKFMGAVGFIPYEVKDNRVYMRVNIERLRRCKPYSRFYMREE